MPVRVVSCQRSNGTGTRNRTQRAEFWRLRTAQQHLHEVLCPRPAKPKPHRSEGTALGAEARQHPGTYTLCLPARRRVEFQTSGCSRRKGPAGFELPTLVGAMAWARTRDARRFKTPLYQLSYHHVVGSRLYPLLRIRNPRDTVPGSAGERDPTVLDVAVPLQCPQCPASPDTRRAPSPVITSPVLNAICRPDFREPCGPHPSGGQATR